MKHLLTLIVLGASPALAQHYLVAGGGFSVMQFHSQELDRFQSTYNAVNAGSGQSVFLEGFDLGIGLNGELGLRHFGKWSKAITIGYQEHKATDFAAFLNGASRNLELKIRHFYVQPAFGFAVKKVFVEGFAALFLNRKLKLDSQLKGETNANPLTGIYRSEVTATADLGLALGIRSGPIILITKFSHPIHKSGGSDLLNDPAPAKVADGLSAFPDDYDKYVAREPYQGVASDIDGLKVAFTLNYAFPLSSQRKPRD
ncbi:hypothetical protein HUU05_26895 [candidate division KSB1 bacterium]|nr:hypothetical protein [candidate division KSB1 bacterium]